MAFIDSVKNMFTREVIKEVVKERIIERPVFVIPPYMLLAFKEYGVKEYTNGSSPDVLKYLQSVLSSATDDSIPWCSAFVNWVMVNSGSPHTDMANAKSWLRMGQAQKEFRAYSVVVLKRGNEEWQGHVGFAICERGPNVYVLGGNQSDCVSIAPYLKSHVISYQIFS
jgi:uncharacterized protein (TIGR02594 family)